MFSKKEIIILVFAAFVGVSLAYACRLEAHPDSETPYWYPSSYIYGFVQGCCSNVQGSEEFREFWPDDTKMICGCVLDAVRHSIPWKETESEDPVLRAKFHDITSTTLPICMLEIETLKKEAGK